MHAHKKQTHQQTECTNNELQKHISNNCKYHKYFELEDDVVADDTDGVAHESYVGIYVGLIVGDCEVAITR